MFIVILLPRRHHYFRNQLKPIINLYYVCIYAFEILKFIRASAAEECHAFFLITYLNLICSEEKWISILTPKEENTKPCIGKP